MMARVRAILVSLAVSVALLLVPGAVLASEALARYPVPPYPDPGDALAPPGGEGTLSTWWALVVIGAMMAAVGIYAWLADRAARAARRETPAAEVVDISPAGEKPSERKAA